MHNFEEVHRCAYGRNSWGSTAFPALSRFSAGFLEVNHDPMRLRPSFYAPLSALAGILFFAPCAGAEESPYTVKEASRDGIGKVYMGREISQTVSSHAISWLERRDREGEEKPSLVIEHLGLRPTDVVADIGAGSGYFSFLLAPLVPEGKVIAQDIQQEMLDFVEGTKKLKKILNVEPLLGTIEDSRLPASGVDLVIMVDAYHEFSHPREMMESIVKGLTPGGRVVFIEYRGEDPTVPIKPLHKMTVKQITAEMAAVGLEFAEIRDFLPIQHFIVFRKPENKPSAP
jgi:SAM-dependent methyltransferase